MGMEYKMSCGTGGVGRGGGVSWGAEWIIKYKNVCGSKYIVFVVC